MSQAARTRGVHVVVPDAIDDPARPSGGNRYDRRICRSLSAAGWSVREHPIPDAWPQLGVDGARAAAAVIAELPDDALVLVDGLIASASAPVFVLAARRVRLVVLVHLPVGLGGGEHERRVAEAEAEAAALTAARAVIATSTWTRDLLLDTHRLAPTAVHVAEPGVDPAPRTIGSVRGRRLLSVGAVAPHKGHDVLVAALGALGDQLWRCACVGPLDRDPLFVAQLRSAVDAAGLADRLRFTGPLADGALENAYGSADLLVHVSRGETYGMVVTEALARGVPVVAAATGGLPATLGHAPDGRRPGLLVPPDDPGALALALRDWLTDAQLRRSLRDAALARVATLSTWQVTADRIAGVLTTVAA